MSGDIAGGVPISVFGGNLRVFTGLREMVCVENSAYWEILPQLGENIEGP
jgi:hypothetical protein